jgi:hypothetical protein
LALGALDSGVTARLPEAATWPTDAGSGLALTATDSASWGDVTWAAQVPELFAAEATTLAAHGVDAEKRSTLACVPRATKLVHVAARSTHFGPGYD